MEFIAPPIQKLETNKIALIDADFLKYLVVYKVKKDYDNNVAHIHTNPVAIYTQEYLDRIFASFSAKGFIFCFSGSSENTFRTSVSFEKKYKGTREYVDTYPNELQDKSEVVKYVRSRYPSLLFKDLEADDVLSMLQDEHTFIYSNDKDLLQIPGTHYDIKKAIFKEITQIEAFKFLMTQMVTGDSVDNISGLKAYGPIKTEKLLTNVGVKNLPFTVLLEYMKVHGLFNGIDCFVESWNLLKLRGNRGSHFLSEYKSAFDLLNMLKLEILNEKK